MLAERRQSTRNSLEHSPSLVELMDEIGWVTSLIPLTWTGKMKYSFLNRILRSGHDRVNVGTLPRFALCLSSYLTYYISHARCSSTLTAFRKPTFRNISPSFLDFLASYFRLRFPSHIDSHKIRITVQHMTPFIPPAHENCQEKNITSTSASRFVTRYEIYFETLTLRPLKTVRTSSKTIIELANEGQNWDSGIEYPSRSAQTLIRCVKYVYSNNR